MLVDLKMITRLSLIIGFVISTALSSFAHSSVANSIGNTKDTIPSALKGNFTDDYGIDYSISDSLWVQLPNAKYHILKWDIREQYIIAVNDNSNKTAAGLFTRIDYVMLPNMKPFEWGFCLSVYDAKSAILAENGYKADKVNPRKGCNGFPFSRMKR